MGMDLVPRHKGVEDLHYNWSGWRWLQERVPVQFADLNDGDYLTADECRLVASWIEQHADEYNEAFGGTPKPMGYGASPAKEHAEAWRSSGGVWQF